MRLSCACALSEYTYVTGGELEFMRLRADYFMYRKSVGDG